MDFTAVMQLLKDATLYDLYRINVAIHHAMENPDRIKALRACFAVGDTITYFNGQLNNLSQATVLQKNLKYVVVRDLSDNRKWNIPYYMLNLTGKESDIKNHGKEKLTKNHLKVGDFVGFDYDGKQYFGTINKLNYKTASLTTQENKSYRVSYGMLFKVLAADHTEIFGSSMDEDSVLLIHQHDT